MLPRWRGELEEEASMNMSPLLFRRSLHSRAGLVLSSTMVARSDGDFLRSATIPSSPSLHPWWKTGRAVVFAGRALRVGWRFRTIQVRPKELPAIPGVG